MDDNEFYTHKDWLTDLKADMGFWDKAHYYVWHVPSIWLTIWQVRVKIFLRRLIGEDWKDASKQLPEPYEPCQVIIDYGMIVVAQLEGKTDSVSDWSFAYPDTKDGKIVFVWHYLQEDVAEKITAWRELY